MRKDARGGVCRLIIVWPLFIPFQLLKERVTLMITLSECIIYFRIESTAFMAAASGLMRSSSRRRESLRPLAFEKMVFRF